MIKRVDTPDHALNKYLVFISGQKHSQKTGRKFVDNNRIGWLIAGKHFLWQQGIKQFSGHTGCLQFFQYLGIRLAPHQGFRLRQTVCHELLVMLSNSVMTTQRQDKVARHQSRSLMQQLKKCVLAIDSDLSPYNRTGIKVQHFTKSPYPLPV
ncbi:hypothetical protein A9J41_14825 [Laribacter hongkongensis]|nr:hypothetical protein [Laribacter hongkongensis]